MSTLFIIKSAVMLVATVMAVIALVKLGKQKAHFQIYPDSIKKEYFKEVRMMTILNIVSVALIFSSFFTFDTNFFFIITLTSMFVTMNTLIQLSEDFGDFKDDQDNRK